MRQLVLLLACLVLALALPAAASDQQLAPHAPEKLLSNAVPPPADPEVLRQGGDTIADAVAATIPCSTTGSTVGYNDDYDEDCPYVGYTADVVYSLTPEFDLLVDIDLCGSSYDTKVYVYDEDFGVIACNDDFYGGEPCGAYVSKIEGAAKQTA